MGSDFRPKGETPAQLIFLGNSSLGVALGVCILHVYIYIANDTVLGLTSGPWTKPDSLKYLSPHDRAHEHP